MSRISESSIDSHRWNRLLGHRPEILERWEALDEYIADNGVLSPELKEEVRRSLAVTVGCRFCASFGDPATEHVDRRESLAVAYAQLLLEPRTIEDETFAVLREEFNEAEIVELTIWALFKIAAQGFGAALDIEAATDTEVAAVGTRPTQSTPIAGRS